MTALEEIKKALEGVTPVAWAWKGPKGGFLADDKKPSWDCEPLYSAAALESLQRENERLREALEEIRDDDSYEKRESFDDSGKHITRTVYGELGEIARTALASTGGEHHAE
jgi:hypothetical protein